MNICRVTRAFIPLRDGISHHAFYLSKHQVRLGHRVWVLQPHHASLDMEGFHVEQIPLGLLTSRYDLETVTALFALRAGFRATALHRRHRLALVHGHGDVVEAFILGWFARALKVPLVMNVHSRLSRKASYRAVAPRVWRDVDAIIAVGREVADDLQKVGVDPARLTMITSGVELDRFVAATEHSRQAARTGLGIPSDAFVVVTVGNLKPVKGFRNLIEAVQRLRKSDLHAYILGEGPERAELEHLSAGVPGIHLVGSVPHSHVVTYLQAADLFVLTSIDLRGVAEGTPTAVMEAMAVGLPIVVTDSGGAKDLIGIEAGGQVVPQRDSHALADAIQGLIESPALRQRLGELNRQRAQGVDWAIIARSVCDAYQKAGAEGA